MLNAAVDATVGYTTDYVTKKQGFIKKLVRKLQTKMARMESICRAKGMSQAEAQKAKVGIFLQHLETTATAKCTPETVNLLLFGNQDAGGESFQTPNITDLWMKAVVNRVKAARSGDLKMEVTVSLRQKKNQFSKDGLNFMETDYIEVYGFRPMEDPAMKYLTFWEFRKCVARQ